MDMPPIYTKDLRTSSQVTSSTPTATTVEFFRESNGMPGLQMHSNGDLSLGIGQMVNGVWEIRYTPPTNELGIFDIYAMATDAQGKEGSIVRSRLWRGKALSWSN